MTVNFKEIKECAGLVIAISATFGGACGAIASIVAAQPEKAAIYGGLTPVAQVLSMLISDNKQEENEKKND